MTDPNVNTNGLEIAVIGMAGRFPGAKNIEEYWNNLQNGIESISFFSDEELESLNVDPELLKNPNYVNVKGGELEDKEFFDPGFFGYSPKEAEVLNPQTRVLLECAWHALESAGYDSGNHNSLIGLYAGAGTSLYWEYVTLQSGKCNALGYFASKHLYSKDFLTTQIAYKLNLKGPAFSVQTACSTSLVAIHLACQGLLNGECDVALAGGIEISAQEKNGYIFQEGMINSPDGHCRAFDARAKGTVSGEGAGVVLLKPLDDALNDNDYIYAIIKGTAINNDGLRKVGYTAPSIEGQADAIRTAQQMAQVEPESISYIEAHGTATELGDPVEIEALKLAFNTSRKNYCSIGSVKTNIGHLDAAAGVAGFIKTVLALNHQQLPPSLHYKTPNPRIDFKNSPFYVIDRLKEWDTNGYPRRAGVSSFGIGGTNAHVILEEWQGNNVKEREKADSNRKEYQILPLSAKTPAALDRITENLNRYLKENNDISLADAAYTLAVKRKKLECKRIVVCKDRTSATQTLSDLDSRKVHTLLSKNEERQGVFMFAGLGSQYVNMGRELYDKEPRFRDHMDRCFRILEPMTPFDVREILYPPGENETNVNDPRIREFEIAQLVIFCFEYALASLIIEWGITPAAMIGYSFGEFVAAAIAGVYSLEDVLKLIVSRGKLIGTLPGGAMMSVPMTRDELEPLLGDALSIAIDNGPTCIVAGKREDVGTLEEQLKEKKIICFPMGASNAIHTSMMDPVLPEIEHIAASIPVNPPQIPYISNLTGKWQNHDSVAKPSYWARHMVETVRFCEGIKELLKKENPLFIEIGPGRDLSALVGRYFDSHADRHTINLVRPAEQRASDYYYLLNKIGRLWLLGQPIDWQAYYTGQTRHRIPLPVYPFEKQRFWIDFDPMKHVPDRIGKSTEKQVSPADTSPKKGVASETVLAQSPANLQSRPQLMNPYTPPRSKVEQNLTWLWQEIFGYDQIGIDDNFMELGGDSLTAIKFTSQLKKSGALVALKDVLENQTIRQLASFIGERNSMQEFMADIQEEKHLRTLDCIEKLNYGQNKKSIFLVHPLHGMVYQYREIAGLLEKYFNVYGIQAAGLDLETTLAETPQDMLRDYVNQILSVQDSGPFYIGGYCAGTPIAYEISRRLEHAGHTVAKLIMFDGLPFPVKTFKQAMKLRWRPGFSKKRVLSAWMRGFREEKNNIPTDEITPKKQDDTETIKDKMRNHIRLLARYILPMARIKAPILSIKAELEPHSDDFEDNMHMMTRGEVVTVVTKGDHDSIFEQPNVQLTARCIETNL